MFDEIDAWFKAHVADRKPTDEEILHRAERWGAIEELRRGGQVRNKQISSTLLEKVTDLSQGPVRSPNIEAIRFVFFVASRARGFVSKFQWQRQQWASGIRIGPLAGAGLRAWNFQREQPILACN